MFAKLFETIEHGQILVMLDSNDQGEPLIRYCCQPKGLGVCSAESPPFENSEHGWSIAETLFEEESEASAKDVVEACILAPLEDMEVVEIPYEQQSQCTIH